MGCLNCGVVNRVVFVADDVRPQTRVSTPLFASD